MAGGAGEVEIGAPAGGEVGGAFGGAVGVVGRGDQHRGEGQGIARHVAERGGVVRQRLALVVRRGDEEGAAHLGVVQAGCGVDDGRDAQ